LIANPVINLDMRTFLTILFVAGLAVASYYVSNSSGSPTRGASQEVLSPQASDDAQEAQLVGEVIRCQGKLEPASGLINIVAPVGSRISRLIDVPVGGTVNQGDVLVTLQSRDIRQQDLKLAQARRLDAIKKAEFEKDQAKYKLSSAKLAVEEAGAADEKIATEKQKIKLLQRQFSSSETLLESLKSLRANPATRDLLNQTDLDKQQLVVEQLRMQIETAHLEVQLGEKSAARAQQAAQNNVLTVESSLENSDKAVPLTTLDAAVEMAQVALDMTEIKSPIETATILDVIVREGDSVTNKPVMVIGKTSEMHCIAEVSDQFLPLIDLEKNPGMVATISASALPKDLSGKVISKGVMIGAASLSDPNPFGKVDRRTGNVTIKLDDPAAAAELVNLQVNVEIKIQKD
jgi:ABC exporter DevB family membrane fusion protein